MKKAKWIWLNEKQDPSAGATVRTPSQNKNGAIFAMTEFQRCYTFSKPLTHVEMDVCADTSFRLFIDDTYLGSGPVSPGGDYDGALHAASGMSVRSDMPYVYSNHYTYKISDTSFIVRALVQLSPTMATHPSHGRGGFYLCGKVFFTDGTTEEIVSDESFEARYDPTRPSLQEADYTRVAESFAPVRVVDYPATLKSSPLPLLTEEPISAPLFSPKIIPPHTIEKFTVLFDKIYSAYATLSIEAGDFATIQITTFEVEERPRFTETVRVHAPTRHRMLRMNSIGGYTVTVENTGNKPLTITHAGLIFIHYPVEMEGSFHCSDEVLNQIYEVGKWTLGICRQSLHLDSPSHQENLGCTGDYFVESLMAYYAFGDTILARFDLVRTADLLRSTDGFMFHTTYSLIWMQMLYEYYRYSGDESILTELWDAVKILLARFHSYYGENGILDTPPNYMFVDWIYVDGYSLHHPPKALGQTVLNAFYYKALTTAATIGKILHSPLTDTYAARAESLRIAFNDLLYDREIGLYAAGLNTPASVVDRWQPENCNKRYFSIHANTLAVLYDLCPPEEAARILHRSLDEPDGIPAQPYFMHFVMEAIDKAGLFETCGLETLRRWQGMIEKSDKGLREGWLDMPGYGYDFSHAWGGTPTYQLPSKLLGLRILKPGFRKIALAPKRYGLVEVDITLPTPFGLLHCHMDEGGTRLDIPEGIEVE